MSIGWYLFVGHYIVWKGLMAATRQEKKKPRLDYKDLVLSYGMTCQPSRISVFKKIKKMLEGSGKPTQRWEVDERGTR